MTYSSTHKISAHYPTSPSTLQNDKTVARKDDLTQSETKGSTNIDETPPPNFNPTSELTSNLEKPTNTYSDLSTISRPESKQTKENNNTPLHPKKVIY